MPSYIEVTSLDSGRTIVVRVDRRGPMDSTNLVELSAAAAAQLGLSNGHSAVRVRRVNPPEQERALLRAGAQVPERMPTPKALLAVLARKLDTDTTVTLARTASPAPQGASALAVGGMPAPAARPQAMSSKAANSGAALPRLLAHSGQAQRPVAAVPAVTLPPAPMPKTKAKPFAVAFGGDPMAASVDSDMAVAPAPAPVRKVPVAAARKPLPPRPTAKPEDIVAQAPVAETGEAMRSGMLVIQAGAFAVKGNAQSVAAKLGAKVNGSGNVWRVRIGPFANREQAEAALAKVHAAGYSQARIQRAD